MSSITPNYTVVGNPALSEDYILTNTSADDYLTFNEAGIINIDRTIEIIARLNLADRSGRAGIFSIGNRNDYENAISMYIEWDTVCVAFGSSYASVYTNETDEDGWCWYKIKFDLYEGMAYSYYSIDGKNWIEYGSNQMWGGMPYISTADNVIGIGAYYGTNFYLTENLGFCDLNALKINVDGETWYSAVAKQYDPIVKANNLYVDPNAFSENKKITSINCNNATFVNNDMSYAFVNCTNLMSITNINQNVTNMSYAFAGLPEEFYEYEFPSIPNSVQDISGLFAYHLEWSDIPVNAMLNAWSKLPTHLQNSAAGFLDGCRYLYNVPSNTLPDFMTNISNGFRNCRSMTNMPIITNNVVDMSGAFENCTSLNNTAYSIPNSVTNMSRAFRSTYITSTPSFAANTNINDMSYAFANCSKLTNVANIPSSATNMSYTFASCYNLTTSSPLPSNVIDLSGCYHGCKLTSAPTIPSSVTNMCSTFAFTNITAAPTIPANVQDMSLAFDDCFNLVTGPTIPANVTNLACAFRYDNKLNSVNITSNNITNMQNAFYNCINLKSIGNLPNQVENLASAFYNCRNLTGTFIIPNTTTNLTYAFYYCSNLTGTPDISNVTNINSLSGTFAYTKISTPPVIPANVKTLDSTFSGCSNLKTAPTIPNGATSMSMTFSSCTNLINAPEIPDSVNNMRATFQSCYNLVNAPTTLPPNVTDLYSCFSSCRNVTTFPEIPNKVTNAGMLFASCYNHTKFPTLPNTVTHMYSTYRGCRNLTVVDQLPPNVIDVNSTYNNCYNLISAPIIHNTVVNMNSTFYNCTNLMGPVFIKSKNINNVENCFGNTSTWKNVYIHMYNTESVTKNLYCWNEREEGAHTVYTDYDYSSNQEEAYDIPVYYANGTKMPNTKADVYMWGGTILYVSSNNTEWYECEYNSSGNTTVTKPAGSESDVYDLFKNEYKTVNGTIVGDLITNDGIISGFSESNYFTIPSPISSTSEFKIYMKIHYPDAITTDWPRILCFNTNNCIIYSSSTGKIGMNDGNNDLGTVGNNLFGKDIWIRFTATSTNLTFSITEDNNYSIENLQSWENSVTWLTQTSNQDFRANLYNTFYLGCNGSRPFPGTIDLNNCIMYSDNVIVWKGTKYLNGITLKDIDGENKNFEVIGQLTNTNEIYSDFSDNNYIKVNGDFYSAVSNGASWEMHVKIITGTLGSRRKIIASGAGDNHWLGIESSKVWRIRLRAQTTTNYLWDFTGTTILTNNTLYYAKLCFDGSKYSLYYSTDNKNWTLEGSKNSTDIIGNVSSLTTIGIGLTDNTSYHNPFNGSIDLNECYIKINNEYWWEPYGSWKEPNITQRILTNTNPFDYKTFTSNGDGLVIPKAFNPGTKSWEIQARFKKIAHGGQWTDPITIKDISLDNSNHKCLTLEDTNSSGNSSMWFVASTDGSGWNHSASHFSIPLNTYYYYQVGWNGSQVYCKYSQDGSSWITTYSSSSSQLFGLNTNTFLISLAMGNCTWEFDLSQCYVQIEGQDWWRFKYITKEDI